jgi:hypothetical protein
LHDRLETLEDTYNKAQIKRNGTKGCSKFLKLNLAAHANPINLKKYNVIPENSRHDMPLQAI